VLCSQCDLSSASHGRHCSSYAMTVPPAPPASAQEVSFEIEVAGLAVSDVQSNLATYAQALAVTLGITVDRITLTTATSRRLVEGNRLQRPPLRSPTAQHWFRAQCFSSSHRHQQPAPTGSAQSTPFVTPRLTTSWASTLRRAT
jgi:hypothetical protein